MSNSGSPRHAASNGTAQAIRGGRGFCEQCGSVLFWKGDGYDYIAIAAGSIDGKLGVTLDGHIFCDSAGDYYQITGGRFRAPGLHKEP
jgi:hypothetical protein